MKRIACCLACLFYLLSNALAQTDTLSNKIVIPALRGSILDKHNQQPLAYVNIINLNSGKGSISNGNGDFSIDISSLNDSNIIRFQCIGYKTKEYKIESLKRNCIILLSENIYALDEILILGMTPNPEKIIKSILQNKELNYKTITKKEQVFLRERSTSDILSFKLNLKKSNISVLTDEMIQKIEENIPKYSQSYSDFLTNVYIKQSELKFEPIKSVALKEKEITELANLEEKMQNLFNDTDKDEYWRIKTGIFSERVDLTDSDSSNATSIKKYTYHIKDYVNFATFKDKNEWEFLYKINKYNFEIIGGTSVNNESVYIIDFSPKKKGRYQGRIYVSVETSALIRADYKYAPNKLGRELHILGFGYTQTNFSGSIYFEKEKDKNNYNLKYLSYQNNYKISINRKVSLQKKKKRLFLNKKLNETKLALSIIAENHESIELLVIDQFKTSDIEFDNFIEEKYIDVTYVNQFNKDLWRNYTTIEPTQEMKEYKKLED